MTNGAKRTSKHHISVVGKRQNAKESLVSSTGPHNPHLRRLKYALDLCVHQRVSVWRHQRLLNIVDDKW